MAHPGHPLLGEREISRRAEPEGLELGDERAHPVLGDPLPPALQVAGSAVHLAVVAGRTEEDVEEVVLPPETAVEVGLEVLVVVGIGEDGREGAVPVRHVPGLVRLDAQEDARGHHVALSGGHLRGRDEERIGVRGLGDDLEVHDPLDGVADEEGLEGVARRPAEEVGPLELQPVCEALALTRGAVPGEVPVQVHLLVGVPHLVDHLGLVALAQLLVVDGVDELGARLARRVLGEVDDGEDDLEQVQPAALGHRRGVDPREHVLERAVLAVVLLLLHGDVLADEGAEWILRPRGDPVLRRVAVTPLLVGGRPLQVLDALVGLGCGGHRGVLRRR